ALVPQVSMAAPQAKPGVEFFDPLSDIYSSHVSSHSSDPSNYLLGFEGGEYVVKTVNPAYDRSPTVAAGGVYGDVDVAVDARLYGETAGSYLKVECRLQPDGSGSYGLTIAPAASKSQLD